MMDLDINEDYEIKLSDIWSRELKSLHYSLRRSKRNTLRKSEGIFFKILYKQLMRVCLLYGDPFLVKEQNEDDFKSLKVKFEEIRNSLIGRIEFGKFFHSNAFYDLSQEIIVPKEYESYNYWFVIKLRQFDRSIKEIDTFLMYHLESTFEGDIEEFSDFLVLALRQFEEDNFLSNRVYETVLEYTEFLYDYLYTGIETFSSSDKIGHSNLGAFVLLNSGTTSNFVGKQNEKFIELHARLIEDNYIDSQTSYTHFKGLFLGEPLTSDQKIHWIGKIVDLKAFVDALLKKKIIEQHKSIWKLTSQCFLDKNKKPFNSTPIRNSKPKAETTKEFLKMVAKLT